MRTQNFTNGTRKLTLIKIVDTKSDYTSTHFFTIEFEDETTDNVAINLNVKRNYGSWLEDNCDIEGTNENIELFTNLLNS